MKPSAKMALERFVCLATAILMLLIASAAVDANEKDKRLHGSRNCCVSTLN
jgi:hypothetical protein